MGFGRPARPLLPYTTLFRSRSRGARTARSSLDGELDRAWGAGGAHRSHRPRRRSDGGAATRRRRDECARPRAAVGCSRHRHPRARPGLATRMKIIRTVGAQRQEVAMARAAGNRVGLVPTMGAFHDGHLSLMRRARERCGFVVVSLFVNPTQFNEQSDLDRYPRDEARDAAMAESVGVDALFAPAVEQVYPQGFSTMVEVSGVSEPLEGAMRGPAHF